MLKKLTTKNFRKLTDNTFEFGPGLQVVRGANEAGKSTMLEAVGYALFGIKSCREDLAGVVTWGQPERSLKVELTIEVGGVDYIITRGKSGAEVNYDGGRVVGQSECTAFVERLMGVNNASTGRLMLSSQGAIRGALDQGPKATMQLIESLANFGVIDQVIELIQGNLLTGPATTAEDRVKRAQETLAATQAAVVIPDTDTIKTKIAEVDATILRNQEELKHWAPLHDAAKKEMEEADAQHRLRETLRQQRVAALAVQETHRRQMNESASIADVMPQPKQILELELQIEAAGRRATLRAAFERLGRLQAAYPDSYWEGDAASLQADINRVFEVSANARGLIAAGESELRKLRSQLTSGTGKCGACGQDLPNKEAIERHSAEIREKIVALEAALPINKRSLIDADNEGATLQAVQKLAEPYQRAAAELGEHVKVDWNFVPPQITWQGLPPNPVAVDTSTLQRNLTGLKQRRQDAEAAQARCKVLDEALTEDSDRLEHLDLQINNCFDADDLVRLREKFEEVAAQFNARQNNLIELRYTKDRLATELAAMKDTYERQLAVVVKSEQDLQRAESELAQLAFNNALLKRVRAARPIIADKLWTIVLASVSTYFSAMRGTRSVVTRADNSFKVDGQSVEGLSGSTLDILGLAIRLALTRTFLPTTPFLILDEPAAACDDERASSMLGFLVSAGFAQTLLITHEAASESVAQNLITI